MPDELGDRLDLNADCQAAEEGTDRYIASFKRAPIGLAHLTPEGNWQDVNQRFCDMLGYTAGELTSLKLRQLTHPDDLAQVFEHNRRLVARELDAFCLEVRYCRKDGDWIWTQVTANLVWDETRNVPLYFIKAIEDIGLRKRHQEAEIRRQAMARREILLSRISETARTSLDLKTIESVTVDGLAAALGADRCFFCTIDTDADTVRLDYDHHRADLASLVGCYRMAEYGVDPLAILGSVKTSVVENIETVFSGVLVNGLRAAGLRSFLIVPLFETGRLVAAFMIAMADGPRLWTAEERELSESVAAQTRSALQAARLTLERQRRNETEALINRIGVVIRSSATADAIQAAAVELLGQALGADRCHFALYDFARGTVTVLSEWHREDLPPLKGVHSHPNTRAMYEELYKGTSTSVVTDIYRGGFSKQTIENMRSVQLRSRISVALAESNGLTSMFTAGMAEAAREWTAEEVQLIESVTTQMRSAVERAHVEQREHRIATELQRALQPALPEVLPGLRIAAVTKAALDEAAIGGDFYDAFPLDSDKYAVVIGDVSGKGLAAAAQIATVRNMLRAMLYQYGKPVDAVSVLNHILNVHSLLDGFVTALVCVYEAASGSFTYASCGHEPGLILRWQTNQVDVLQTTGPPIGAVDQIDYGEHSFQLHTGDTLVLYTDGLSEAGPTRTQFLGTEGLVNYLSELNGGLDVKEAAEWIVDRASSYANGLLRDDVCVLVIRRAKT